MDKTRYTIGIDEVGRGPIAGPVCVCAFKMKGALQKVLSKMVWPRRGNPREEIRGPFREKLFATPVKDSKKLSAKQREAWFTEIKKWKKEGKCDFALCYVSAKEIDKIGIAKAIKKALEKSLLTLNPNTKTTILLDGGLKAPKEFINQKTIIKGDEKEVAIALASIVAKVSRDALMIKISKKFPNYEFHLHKGYGTRLHYKKIKKHGISSIHRESFL